MKKLSVLSLLLALCFPIWATQTADKSVQLDSILTADGPYILYQPDNSVRIVSVTSDGVIEDKFLPSLPSDTVFNIISHDGKHHFEVKLHEIERPHWQTTQPDKIFVMSDPHGNLDCVISLLQANGVIDADYHWSFGANQLMVIGDVADRGNDAIQIYWLLYKLEEEARQAGGRVDFMLGNHEPMVLMDDLRYTKPKYKKLAERLGMPYPALLGPTSELGRWFCTRNTMHLTGPFLFVHAGLSKEFLDHDLDIPTVNENMSLGLYKKKAERKEVSPLVYFLFGNKGPIWYRGMVKDAEKYDPLDADTLNLILKRYEAERIIVGHTIFEDVSTFYDGRVIGVNVDNAENRAAGRGRGILIEKDCIYVVGDNGIMRKLFE